MVTEMKLTAALLDYPGELTCEILAELPEILSECRLIDRKGKDDIAGFAAIYGAMPLIDWQMAYSELFDVAPVTSLYLFEHVYGSSTKRGAAMASLKDTYRRHGLEMANDELPDYLPTFLDFLSTLEDETEMMSYLADISPLLKSMHGALEKNHSHYARLLGWLVELSAKGEPHPVPEKPRDMPESIR